MESSRPNREGDEGSYYPDFSSCASSYFLPFIVVPTALRIMV